ncbi:MAG: hypothetical protein EKK65_00825 [Lysobacterales bacterium]|nr:MAG: hypothetical protein EKK65_00825 [Xanthomonadales bacterium]
MTTPCDSRTCAPAGACVASCRQRLRRGVWLAGCLLVLGGCVEPAYYGGSPYYEERNSYYESRPVYTQPDYYGGSYYRPAPRVQAYYYDRGYSHARRDRDWHDHDRDRRGRDYRDDDRRSRNDGRGDEHREARRDQDRSRDSGDHRASSGRRTDLEWTDRMRRAQGGNGETRPYD